MLVDGGMRPAFVAAGLPTGVRVSVWPAWPPTNPRRVHLGSRRFDSDGGFTALNTGFLHDGAFV